MKRLPWYSVLFLFFFNASLDAQAPRFYTYTDAREVTTNTFFQISFVLENMRGTNFIPPDFGELTIISGPSTSNEMQIINGRTTSKMSYVYGVTASKPGNYQIGEASIRANNKVYKSQVVSLKVVQGRAGSQISEEEQVFFRMEISDSIGYIGQQIRLDYVLYSSKDVRAQSFQSESAYDGFFARMVRDFTSRTEKVIINDIQYSRDVIRTVSLFPQQTGTYELEPATIRAAVPIEGAKSRGFFFGTPSKSQFFKTNQTVIRVKNLPQDVPESFSGGVGKFNMQCRLNKAGVEVGDAITLTMQVNGNGDPKLMTAPALERIPGLDYFEPNLIDEQTSEDRGIVVTTKTWEYLIVPEKSGAYRLNPSYSYFDPDSSRYITFHRGPYVVRAGNSNGNNQDLEQLSEAATSSLFPIYLTSHWMKKDKSFFKSGLYWFLSGLALFFALTIFLYRHYLKIEQGKDILDMKALKAQKVAVKRLKTAAKYMNEGMERDFYDELSKVMLTYIGDKLRMPASEISKLNVEMRMQQLNIPSDQIQSFLTILKSCELALFARKPEGGMKSLYGQTLGSIAEVENFLGK